jgi:hypothetical protein
MPGDRTETSFASMAFEGRKQAGVNEAGHASSHPVNQDMPSLAYEGDSEVLLPNRGRLVRYSLVLEIAPAGGIQWNEQASWLPDLAG